MRRFQLAAAVIIVLSLSSSAPALSAELRCLDQYPTTAQNEKIAARFAEKFGAFPPYGKCRAASLVGPISPGDSERFLALIRANHPHIEEIVLQSPGGSALDGIQIGKLLRKYLMRASAPLRMDEGIGFLSAYSSGAKGFEVLCHGPSCICASACALIWFGAIERKGSVGLHRPILTDPSFRTLNPEQASTRYREVLGEIEKYMTAVEAPRVAVDSMVATDSSEIKWVDEWDDNLEEPPAIAEWINASCGSFTVSDAQRVAKLRVRQNELGDTLSPQEGLLLKELTERDTKRMLCSSNLKWNHRLQTPPP